MLNIELIEYEKISKENSCIIGEASFYIPEKQFTARKVKHLKKGNRSWFNWPSFCIEDGDDKQWYPFGEFPREYSDQIFEALKIEVSNHLDDLETLDKQEAKLPF